MKRLFLLILSLRLLNDHQVSMETLSDTAKQLNFDLSSYNSNKKSNLGDLNGDAFENKYLGEVIGINSQLMGYLKQVIPAMENPVLKKILANYLPRVSSLLENAKSLQKLK